MNCPSIEIDTCNDVPEEIRDIVELTNIELEEISKIIIENDCTISLEVCKDIYENAPRIMKSKDGKIILKFIKKFIEKFAYISYIVVYQIDKGL